MRAGPKRAVSGPERAAPGRTGVTADDWRGLYGSDLFSSMFRGFAFLMAQKRYDFAEYINFRGVFPCKDGALRTRALDPGEPDISDP